MKYVLLLFLTPRWEVEAIASNIELAGYYPVRKALDLLFWCGLLTTKQALTQKPHRVYPRFCFCKNTAKRTTPRPIYKLTAAHALVNAKP